MSSRSGSKLRWGTRANALTAARLLAAPTLAWAILGDAAATATAIFAFAIATDLADGPVARRYGEATPLGGLLDHACDATFVSTGLAALAVGGVVPLVLPGLVVLSFLQYAVDSGALRFRSAAPVPLRASSLGRWNGIAYYVLLGTPIVRDSLGLGWPGSSWVHGAGIALVATTLLSMADRAWAYWKQRHGA